MRFLSYVQWMVSVGTLTCLEAGTWTQLKNSVVGEGVYHQMLMTDGTVLFQGTHGTASTGRMWKLTPDAFGSYLNGTWSEAAPLPVINGVQYAPYAHASAVLANGNVVFVGGEFNGKSGAI